jgi:sodium/bile acid cotransporter 7
MRPKTVWSLTKQAAGTWRALIAPAPAETAARRERIRTLYDGFRPAFAQVAVVEPAQLQVALSAGEDLVLIDVRSEAERRVSSLAGAVSPQTFLARTDHYRGRRAVAFCTLGVRSGAWAAERCADGLPVENLVGGLLAWTHAEGALVTPEGTPTLRLHVYGASWDLVHHAYEGVW